MKKSHYLDLMESTLSAYTTEHILRYYNDVKTNGLTEHGFPRLAANIGILMAHGKRRDLKDIFIDLMDLCCQQIPKVKAANDFSVKEVVFAIQELQKTDFIAKEKIDEWKDLLRTIDPYTCYNQYAKTPEDIVYNWAAFTMVSEFMRQKEELADAYADFIDLQAFSQIRFLDPNNMYRDPGEPAVYDLVTRGLFALLLDQGYEGKYKDVWEKALDSSAMLTLNLQSVTGEIPFGGRSNQFLHNEAHLSILLEYYAKRYAAKGDMETAGKFKAGVEKALANIEYHLAKHPIHHIKNRFPLATQFGCEGYAYFDKYMITAASFLYVAYRICDDTIPVGSLDDRSAVIWQSSDFFHQVMIKAGEYFAQYDYNANYHYDCSGLGRLHKKGAPSELCLSVPCPVNGKNYKLDETAQNYLSIAPGICIDGEWQYATAEEVQHIIKRHNAQNETAELEVNCVFTDKTTVECFYTLNSSGLQITYKNNGNLRCLLPAFNFNGEEYTKINCNGKTLEICFADFICCYTVSNGEIIDLEQTAANRNGYYNIFAAEGKDELTVHVKILKA